VDRLQIALKKLAWRPRFLLQRQTGKAFIYLSSRIDNYYDHIDELGGVAMVSF
jgi:hypothetical protein